VVVRLDMQVALMKVSQELLAQVLSLVPLHLLVAVMADG
jgi:hypothetical protein